MLALWPRPGLRDASPRTLRLRRRKADVRHLHGALLHRSHARAGEGCHALRRTAHDVASSAARARSRAVGAAHRTFAQGPDTVGHALDAGEIARGADADVA